MFAYHPDGRYIGAYIYGPLGADSIVFYEFDLEKCLLKDRIGVFQEKDIGILHFYYIDYLGRYYISGRNKLQGKRFLYRLSGNSTLNKEVLIEYNASKYFIKDLTFYRNKIYLKGIESDSHIFKCDTNFIIIDSFLQTNVIDNFSTIPIDCDSDITYCLGRDIPLDKLSSIVTDQHKFFTYDLEKNFAIDTICNIKTAVSGVSNLSSPLEFLSSDPECDLLIDLDRNNSSGLYPYNFKWKDVFCDQFRFAICDEDPYIHTSFSLDSINLELKGILDPGEESIDGSRLKNGFSLAQRNDSLYVLLSGTDRSDAAYINALKELMYIHSGLNPTSGQRLIKINGYNVVKKGVDVFSYVTIGSTPYAGRDTSILICDQYSNSDLSRLFNTSSHSGSWFPALISGNNSFNSQHDSLRLYQYVVSDTYCGSDTADLKFIKDQIPPVALGPDVELCKGDTVSFNIIKPTNGNIVWSDGDSSSLKVLHNFGFYWVTLTSELGCMASDSIDLKPSLKFEHILRSEYICSNKNFVYKNKSYYPNQSIYDTLLAVLGCDTILQIDVIPVELPSMTSQFQLCFGDSLLYRGQFYYPGDSIDQIRVSNDGSCDTAETIVVHTLSLPQITISGDSLLCPSQKIQLKVNWNGSLLWSTGEQTSSVWVDQPGVFRVIATDANGCSNSAEYNIKNAVNLDYELLLKDPNCPGEASGFIDLKESSPLPGIDKIIINGKIYYAWPVHSLTAGQYQLIVIDQQGCEYNRTVELNEPEVLSPGLPALLELNFGESKTLRLSSQAPHMIIIITIDPNDGIHINNDSTIMVTGIKDSDYVITVTDQNGCEYIYTLSVKINKNQEIFLPNVFSPNDDQINDWFYPQSNYPLKVDQFTIYDRWGNLIFQSNAFETNQISKGWNGRSSEKKCPPGVYIYFLQFSDHLGNIHKLKGEFTLIR